MRLPALEKNILVYRALQMALFLFYAENLRRHLINSVGRSTRQRGGVELKGAKLLEAIFQKLKEDQVLSSLESTELQELLEHRNQIAHHIHLLTGDIDFPGRLRSFRDFLKLKYDYKALDKMKKWDDMLVSRLAKKYVVTVSLDYALFEAAEHAYERELSSLRKRIDRQFKIRQKQIKKKG